MGKVDLTISGREGVADWIETSLLVRGTTQLGLDGLFALAESEIGAAPPIVNLGLGVMKRRGALLQAAYPFDVREVAVRARSDAVAAPYCALLLMTPEGVGRQLLNPSPTADMAVIFERLVTVAAQHLLGDNAVAIRFGWPSDIGRPMGFDDAIRWLADLMGITAGGAYRPPRRKDGGVDVVAWRPFPDGRSGFPVVLVQCTLQADILVKARDVDVRYWAGWLTLDNDPLTALAVPGTISPGVIWDEISVASLILERLRIAGLVPAHGADQDTMGWVADALSALTEMLEAGEI